MNEIKKNKKEINNNSAGSNSSSGTRSITIENNNLFSLDLKPQYANSGINMDNYIKLTGDVNPGKFMNNLFEKIKTLDDLNINININKEKFKLNINFEKEEENLEITDEMKKEFEKLGITENELNYYDEENENIKGKRTVVQIKMFESYNGGYLLRFVKKEGELIDYIEKIQKIYSLVNEM